MVFEQFIYMSYKRFRRLRLLCGFFLIHSTLAQTTPTDGQPNVLDILLRQAKFVENVTSIAYQIERKDIQGKVISKVVWKEAGDNYYFEYHNTGQPETAFTHFIDAYDGQHAYQYIPTLSRMFIRTKPFREDDVYLKGVCTPLVPFEFISTKDTLPTLKSLKSMDILRSVALRASAAPEKARTWFGHQCVPVKISGAYDRRDGKVVDFLVYFAPDLGFFPLAWEIHTVNGEISKTFFIKKLANISTGTAKGETFIYPGDAVLRNSITAKGVIFPTNMAPEELVIEGVDEVLSFPDIKINRSSSEDFTLDPSMANYIQELDSNTLITVPK